MTVAEGVSIVFWRPYRYSSMALKVILPVIDYELKFVKRQFFYDNNKQKILKCIKPNFMRSKPAPQKPTAGT